MTAFSLELCLEISIPFNFGKGFQNKPESSKALGVNIGHFNEVIMILLASTLLQNELCHNYCLL